MIDRLEIHGFRGIVEGVLDGLFPLTLLVGKNNSGKSTCLERILLAAAEGEPQRAAE
ncbi:MAG: AAA family ATPase [Deltaproteobacteria bacterium]|nr:AAA family ATPase [Deltaproteobacteria bacterium]